MEQIQYDLLFRWFVALGIDDEVWVKGVIPERAKPQAEGRRCSRRTATDC